MEEKKINIDKITIVVLKYFILKPLLLPVIIWKQMAVNMSLEDYEENCNKNILFDFPILTWLIVVTDSLIILTYPVGLFIAIFTTLTSEIGDFNTFLKTIIIFFFSPLFLKFFKEILKILTLLINMLLLHKN